MNEITKSFLNSLRDSKILPGSNVFEMLFFFVIDNFVKIKNLSFSQALIFKYLMEGKIVKREFFLDKVTFSAMTLYDFIIYSFGDRGFARGTSFSQEEAFGKCLGEIFERIPFSGELSKDIVKISSINSLKEEGVAFLDLSTLPQATENQKSIDTRFDYDDDSIFEWVEMNSFVTQRKIWVPKQLVYWNSFSKVPEKIIKEQNTNGLASGDTKESAIMAALSEYLQRHVFFEAWYFPEKNLVVEVDLESLCEAHKDIRVISDEAGANMLNLRVFRIKSNLSGVFDVYFSILENKLTGGIYLGCSGGTDSYAVIYRSIQEAFSIYTFTNRILFNGEEESYKDIETNDFRRGIFGNHRVIWWGHHIDTEGTKILEKFLGNTREVYSYRKNEKEGFFDKIKEIFGDFLYVLAEDNLNKKINHYSCRVILPNSYTLNLRESFATPVLHNIYPHNVKAHPFP